MRWPSGSLSVVPFRTTHGNIAASELPHACRDVHCGRSSSSTCRREKKSLAPKRSDQTPSYQLQSATSCLIRGRPKFPVTCLVWCFGVFLDRLYEATAAGQHALNSQVAVSFSLFVSGSLYLWKMITHSIKSCF